MTQETNRYHVQVRLLVSANLYEWSRVRHTNGDPYVFTKDEADKYIRSREENGFFSSSYRLEALPK